MQGMRRLGRLSFEEWQFVFSLPHFAIQAAEFADQAEVFAKSIAPQASTWNTELDAIRHCLWSALMARRFGQDFAKACADAHEARGNNVPGELAMDLHNNEVGRRLGATSYPEPELKNQCVSALKRGELKYLTSVLPFSSGKTR